MLREEYEKETGNKCPEDVFSSLDYYHYEIRYSRWLESKLTAQNTIHNREYKQCCGTCINLADSINGIICTKNNNVQILRNNTCDKWSSIFDVCKLQQI